ncbi:MAG: hypothetical protein SOX15_04235 [Eubacteriales bacterium]|nr:hypothetical protein [Eubacteriales bacterium]
MSGKNLISIGNAGEYFVAGELERHGFTAAIPMSNVKDFDILAINRSTFKQFAIQVKTTGNKKKVWTLSAKNENIKEDNVVYFFVCLNELGAPEYHIVASAEVAESIKESHQKWLATAGKNGQAHKDNPIRKFEDKENKYLNNWGLLGIE